MRNSDGLRPSVTMQCDDSVVIYQLIREHINKQRVFPISKVVTNKIGKVMANNIPFGM